MIFNLREQNSVANRFIAELRNVEIQKDSLRFRRNLERVGEILAYEISKTLNYEEIEVETPLGMKKTTVPECRIVLATILRAGLPLHQGLLNYFDKADNAFVSAYRKHHKSGSFEINMEYISCPNLDNSVLILSDSMLATGASIDIVLKELKEYGTPSKIHIASVLASQSGLDRLTRLYPKIDFWLGAVDEELTAKGYIVPGLGDAGDLAFGSKLQD